MRDPYAFLVKIQTAILSFILLTPTPLRANKGEEKVGFGLVPPSKQQIKTMEKTWERILEVKPNKIGAARIKSFMESLGKEFSEEIASQREELVTVVGPKRRIAAPPMPAYELPHYVNNSTLPSFPPIRSQGSLGSCVAWATGYYQASQEIGFVRGRNNKVNDEGVISPKWIYNLVNFGENRGSTIYDNYHVLTQSGAPSLIQFPYDRNYLSWDLNSQDWIDALSNRMSPPKYISGVNENPQNLQTIKQLLNNGHVLTFGTFISSWVFTTIKSHPDADNRFVGEKAAYWVQGQQGAHMMTIVGYNDDLWIDINGNGQIDAGEKGAFLVANSWGSGWGNQGFIWIAYDAFLSQSQVPNPPSLSREPAAGVGGDYLICCLPKAVDYSPKLVAQFKIGHTARNEIKVVAGVSEESKHNPQRYFFSALSYQGGPYRFDGSLSSDPLFGTFAVDLSDLAIPNVNQKFYLMIRDSEVEKPTYLEAFRLLDLTNGNVIESDEEFPHTIDYDKMTHYLSYTQALPLEHRRRPDLHITYPTREERIQGSIPVTVRSRSPLRLNQVEFYLDGTLIASDTDAPFWILFDSEKYPNGFHDLCAIGYDAEGHMARDQLRIQIAN
jgi:hypothetical protein